MKAKVIKTEAEYEQALSYLDTLMDAEAGTPQEEELDLFSLLISNYEDEHYPIELPDPIEAIKFRMEQEGLSRKDLVPFIGSQSKVSEVLNYHRPLSLSMIRALSEGLGIPAEVLLNEPGGMLNDCKFKYQDYPFVEMIKRGYFPDFSGSLAEAKSLCEELLQGLFRELGDQAQNVVYCKHGPQGIDTNSLRAWQARATQLALSQDLPPFSKDDISPEFIREIVKLSSFSHGPQMAGELLQKKGIHFVILPHLPRTYLDGACFFAPDGHPVIGLTLRHNRLDNFWFTLVHELAHLHLHSSRENLAFFDNTDQMLEHPGEPLENEANQFSRDILFPPDIWASQSSLLLSTLDETALQQIADRLSVHSAIVAGRLRWETKNYHIFSDLIGTSTVHEQFFDKR
jgi:HTH-type transcriptional regulator / antitoxin HigA